MNAKTTMKRALGMILVILMLALPLASCKKNRGETDGKDTTDSNSNSVSTDPGSSAPETDEWGQVKVNNDIPDDLKYGGKKVTFLLRPEDRYAREIMKQGEGSDTVDEKVVQRNREVQEQIGVTLDFNYTAPNGQSDAFNTKIQNEFLAPTGDFDVVMAYAYYATAPTLRACYLDLNSNKAKYLNPTKAYWNQSYVSEATYQDRLYYIVGDMNLSVYDRTMAVYANMKRLGEQGYNNILDTVLDGKWTIEEMYRIVRDLGYEDLDNNGSISSADRVALTSISDSEAYDGFFEACGLASLTEDSSGVLSFNISGNQKMEDALSLVKKLYDQAGVINYNDTNSAHKMFVEGRAYFLVDVIYRNESHIAEVRNMTENYAILPLPKYDEAQEKYMTTPQDAYNLMSVMNTGKTDAAMVSATLELLTSKSYEDVRPYFIENILKIKVTQADNSQAFRVMGMILDGITFEKGAIYGSQLNNVTTRVWRNVLKGGTSVSQAWATYGSGFETKLAEFVDWYVSNPNAGR